MASNQDVAPTQNKRNTALNELKAYRSVHSGIEVLEANFSLANKILGAQSKNNQSAANCIIALAYSKIVPAPYWNKKNVHEVLQLGEKLFKASVARLSSSVDHLLKPNCVYPTLYIGDFKITVFVGNDMITLDQTSENSNTAIVTKMMENSEGVIVNDKNKNFAIFKYRTHTYLFSPQDGISDGRPVKSGTGNAFVLRGKNFEKVFSFLCEFLDEKYSIYSLKVIKCIKIKKSVKSITEANQNNEYDIQNWQSEDFDDNQVKILSSTPPTLQRDLVEMENLFDMRLNTNFAAVENTRGALLTKTFEKDVDMIVFDNLAALVMLHRKKSYSWTSRTVADILSLGKDISASNFGMKAHIDGQMQIVAFDKSYRLQFTNAVIGKVTPKDTATFSIHQGIEIFFKQFDAGCINGPQCIAIWKEKGVYFSFDPKERDVFGRKWTKFSAKKYGTDEKGGGACVMWYNESGELADNYVSNVPLKHRNDAYRITYVKISELMQEYDWGEWKYLKKGLWILQGDGSICSLRLENIKNQIEMAICVLCYAIAYASQHPEATWSRDTLNSLLKGGSAYYEILSQPRIDNSAPKGRIFKINADHLLDLKNDIDIDGKKFALSIESPIISGKPSSNQKDSDLPQSLNNFFQNHRSGVIMFGNHLLAMWCDGEAFYLLDIYGEEDADQINLSRKITAKRFARLNDMINALNSNLELIGSEQFFISRIETNAAGDFNVPLKYYQRLGSNSAILFCKGFHEGHQIFGPRANKQTFFNLIIGLCLALIHDSAEWSATDLVDILKMGDTHYLEITEKSGDCQFQKEDIDFEKIEPKIGMNKFSFETEEHEGVFSNVASASEEGVAAEGSFASIASNATNEIHLSTVHSAVQQSANELAENKSVTEEEEIQAEPLTLLTILKNEDIKPAFAATIKSDFFFVAVWKQHNLYFIFDPKANNEKGNINLKRIEAGMQSVKNKMNPAISNDLQNSTDQQQILGDGQNDTDKIKNKSDLGREEKNALSKTETTGIETSEIVESKDDGAYVAWFQSVEELVDHIKSQIPPQYLDERVTVKVFYINKDFQALKSDDFKNFQRCNIDGAWILRGSFSQDDFMFPNRTYLDGASAIIALAFSLIYPTEDWSKTVLDVIIKYSDRFYTKSLLESPKTEKNIKLDINDLAKSFCIYKLKFDYTVRTFENIFILNSSKDFEEKNLALIGAVRDLGSGNVVGATMTLNKNYIVAIWVNDESIYVFDSHETDPNGAASSGGVASVMRFADPISLFKAMSQKFGGPKEAISFEISKIEMVYSNSATKSGSAPTLRSLRVPTMQSAFVQKNVAGARILAAEAPNPGLSEILINIASVVLSQLLHVECWTPTIIKKAYSLAQNLQDNLHGNGTDTVDTDLDIKNLNRCFTVENVVCALIVDQIISGPISATDASDVSLKNSLVLLLRNFCRFVIVTRFCICSVWREDMAYYLFSISKDEAAFVINTQCDEYLFDWISTRKPDGEGNNWYEIIQVETALAPKRNEKAEISQLSSKHNASKTSGSYSWSENKNMSNMIKHSSAGKQKFRRLFGKEDSLDEISWKNAACVIAAGMCHLRNIATWNPCIFEQIKRASHLLYMDSVAVQGRVPVDIANMEKRFKLQDTQIQVEVLPSTDNSCNKYTFDQILSNALACEKIVYVSNESNSFLAIQWNNKFFAFEPANFTTKSKFFPRSVVKFPSYEKMFEYLLCRIERNARKLSVGVIKVIKMK